VEAVGHRRSATRWGFGLVLGIPLAAITLTWLGLDVPPRAGCDEDPTPAAAAFHDHAIAIATVAAVALMAMIAWASSRRSHDGRPGRPTTFALGAAAAYLVACLLDHEVFAPIGIVGLLPLLISGIGSVALLIGITMLVAGLSGRSMIGLSVLAWLVLLVALPGDVALAWYQATGAFAC
jgi:hypothetical protein